MKVRGVIALLLIGMFTASGLCQQSELEEKIRAVFLQELRTPDLLVKLRQLSDDKKIVAVLMNLATKNRLAKERTSDFVVLNGAVASLGELRATSANDLLSSLLTDSKVHENVRALAARSLGLINPEGNKQTLLRALAPSEHLQIRVYAAEGLAQTRDAGALRALERYSREEKDSHVRQQFEKAARTMRANGVRPN